jgi:ribulose-5-phosphate 4-epimerase/fuculose-1-phosphate aldolase
VTTSRKHLLTCTSMPRVTRGGVLAALAVAVLAGAGGPAAAAPLPGVAHARQSAPPPAGMISTVAGNVGGPAKATNVAVPACGVAYAGGAVRIADGPTVRAVSTQTDFLTTPAGNNTAGTGAQALPGDGGPATSAGLSSACGVALDHHANLAIADANDERIRVVAHSTGTLFGQAMTAGDIYTVAGTGTLGFSGDGGPATAAEFFEPYAVAWDRSGNLVITDTFNNRVRVVAAQTGRFYGRPMTTGDIYTIAGTGASGFSGDGGRATKARLASPQGLAFDHAGNLLIAAGRVRVVARTTGTFYGQAMTAGDIYTIAGGGTHGLGNGGPATSAELFPRGMAVDSAGNLLIADSGDNMVRVVAASTGAFYGQAMTAGDIYTIAGIGTAVFSGDGGPATAAAVGSPTGVALDGSGNVLIAAQDNRRVRVIAVSSGTFYGKAMTAGDIYTIAGNGTRAFAGEGIPALKAQFWVPHGVAVDGVGNLLAVDTANNRIRAVAASTGTCYGKAMTAGDIYTIAGTGRGGFSGDGGPATAAELTQPQAVTLDQAGNLLIADTFNNRVRVVAASTGTFYGQPMTAGDIYTIAGTGSRVFSGDGGPATSAGIIAADVAVDGTGNVLITDNNRIRVVAASTGTFYGQPMTAGDIYTIAGTGTAGFSGDGGHATAAKLDLPTGATADGAGNVVIADWFNNRVRVVAASTGTFYGRAMTAGDIYTIAGTGTKGFSGDGGPATAARLYGPDGPAVDGAGNVVIADSGNNRVRVVAASTGTFYGTAMTAGDIYTVAGDGTYGLSGDGGPATKAALAGPQGVAVDGGNLLIADSSNNRVREVTG